MRIFIIIGIIGILIACTPIWIAIAGNLLSWNKNDPSWGAALPALMFFTIPTGVAISIIGWMIQLIVFIWRN